MAKKTLEELKAEVKALEKAEKDKAKADRYKQLGAIGSGVKDGNGVLVSLDTKTDTVYVGGYFMADGAIIPNKNAKPMNKGDIKQLIACLSKVIS